MTASDHLEYLLSTVGPRLTAVAIGLTDARVLIGYRNGTAPIPEDVSDRLWVTGHFVEIFMDAGYSSTVAAAFLRGSWPDLDGDAPVVAIRDGGRSEWDRVLSIAGMVATGDG